MALQISFGNLVATVGTNIYLQKQAPHYQLGYDFSLAIILVGIAAAVVLRQLLSRVNTQRERMSRDEVNRKYTNEELQDMGDASPLFRYIL